ncbi:MAG TPA: histidine kinase dimerization/phosphoacceptor domain -containing protein [Caulobacteraceae bacterium]|jgi:two-component sensor histidine kinase
MMEPATAETSGHGRNPRRSIHPKAWSGIGPLRSLRTALVILTTLAIAPMMLFASSMAILRASETQRLPSVAAWVTVAALPLMIGIAAILVVSLSWEALVMNWLTYLERLSRAYARGRYSLRPRRLQLAPVEFQALGQAVEAMASAVEHRDQALRDALDEQIVLLREVHHRVKNNLQIVGSLLSLQANRAVDPAAREALLDALVRVDAIALGQRFVQAQEDEEQVSTTELFETFVRQSRARLGVGRRLLEITTEIEPGLISLETGSRLVMLAAEALLHACHALCGPCAFHLQVRFEGESVVLAWSPAPESEPAPEPDGRVSHDLIQGYVRQLKGRIEPGPWPGSTQVRVALPRPHPAAANDTAPVGSSQGPKFFRILDRTERGVAS